MFKKYKLITADAKFGVWVSEVDIIELLQLSKHRNKKIYNKVKNWWEHLNNKKLDDKEIL